ncbi:MAG: DUF58 domain-containing protein [Planctomycetota bacterium]|nr:DUF58 domain-containing protein [Planctomycetota bacterium]
MITMPMRSEEPSSTDLLRTSVKRFVQILSYDFCPSYNYYVYWLKQPAGWFVLALLCSLCVGTFLNPIGWSLAAGLFTVLVIGLVFPWIAVRSAQCELRPVVSELHEREVGTLVFQVRNRLPFPIWGLMVEGYLTLPIDESSPPDIGLSSVPPLSLATFRLPVQPEYRGVYPAQLPQLACAFPFGIWTARRRLTSVQSLTVQPLLLGLSSSIELVGKKIADAGQGNRISSHGDFLGVRAFRRGDPLNSIHWVQSARLDSIIVCERGGPQQSNLMIHLDTSRSLGDEAQTRENLAWRVRIAASIADLCVARHLPFQLVIDGEACDLPIGSTSLRAALNRLATVPLDSRKSFAGASSCSNSECTIEIVARDHCGEALSHTAIRVCVKRPTQGFRSRKDWACATVDLDDDILLQTNTLLREANYERIAS